MLRKNEKRCLPIQSNLQRRRGWLVMGMVLLMAVSIAGLRLPESTVAQESTKTGAGTTTVFEDEIAANSRSSRVPSGEVVTDATDSDSLKIPLKIAVPADIGPKLMQGKILKAPVQARHPGTNKILDSSLVTGVSLYRQGKDPDLLKSLAVAGRPTGKGVLRFSLGDEHFDALESSVLKYEFGSRELGRYKHIEIAYENSTPQPKPTTGPALLASDTPADLRFVESRTAVAVITRPARIVNHPLVKKLAEKSQTIGGGRSSVVDELGKMLHLADCGLKPSQVDQATIVFSDPRQPSQVAVVLRTDEDAWLESDDSNATFKKQFGELEPISFRGEQVLIQKGNEDRYWYIADSKTIVWTLDIHSMRRAIVAKNGPENLKWVSSWRQHANDSVSFYAAAEPIHAMTGFLGGDPVFDLVSPILEETNFAVGGFKADGNLSATITAGFDDAQTATEMAEVVTGLKALTLLMLKRDIESFPKESQQLGRLAMQALGEMKITSKDQTALATTSVKGGEELLAMATPVLKRQNKLAISTDSMNNIRQLGLAMHNYESAFQAFPPPVLYSRHGKAYSWRIALLPFLERNDLYDQYRFDEEWNSPHNRLVTSSMPDVFRHPLSDENSTNSDYFVVTGDETIFPKIKAIAEGKASVKGTGFGQITDGSSNTILLVEAKRNTHWAKPEDIPYQSGETLKDLGGFQKESFVVALADGSTQVCSAKVGKLTLEIFLRKADGQIAYTSNLSNPQPEVEDAGKLFSRTPRRAEPASTKLNMALPIQKPSTIEKQEDYFDDPSSGKRFR